VPTDTFPAREAGAGGDPYDPSISCLADTVRDTIQRKLDELVAERGPAFS
jgi:hypothetical protein